MKLSGGTSLTAIVTNTSVQNLKLAAGEEYRQRSKRQASSSPLSKPKVHPGIIRVQLIPL
jgi:hypothetical protein